MVIVVMLSVSHDPAGGVNPAVPAIHPEHSPAAPQCPRGWARESYRSGSCVAPGGGGGPNDALNPVAVGLAHYKGDSRHAA